MQVYPPGQLILLKPVQQKRSTKGAQGLDKTGLLGLHPDWLLGDAKKGRKKRQLGN